MLTILIIKIITLKVQ